MNNLCKLRNIADINGRADDLSTGGDILDADKRGDNLGTGTKEVINNNK